VLPGLFPWLPRHRQLSGANRAVGDHEEGLDFNYLDIGIALFPELPGLRTSTTCSLANRLVACLLFFFLAMMLACDCDVYCRCSPYAPWGLLAPLPKPGG